MLTLWMLWISLVCEFILITSVLSDIVRWRHLAVCVSWTISPNWGIYFLKTWIPFARELNSKKLQCKFLLASWPPYVCVNRKFLWLGYLCNLMTCILSMRMNRTPKAKLRFLTLGACNNHVSVNWQLRKLPNSNFKKLHTVRGWIESPYFPTSLL